MVNVTAESTKYETWFFALGTVCRITVYKESHREAVQTAKRRVLELHNRFNAYDKSSEISLINRNAGKCYVRVSEDTLGLIRRAVTFTKVTGGLFDICTKPLSDIWKRVVKTGVLPEENEIKTARRLAGGGIRIRGDTVSLKQPMQMLDAGSVAKGFAADEAARILAQYGVERAMINFGGTVIVRGSPAKVGLQNPFMKTGESFGALEVENRAVVSSGLYEQGRVISGKWYHHIVDPVTGYPSGSQTAQVTLVGKNAEVLDALSTAAFILPLEKAVKFIRKHGFDGVLVNKDGQVFKVGSMNLSLS